MGENAVLGISMGTSLAAGYITPEGSITPWLNELAFVPVDYRENAPADEWSGDLGCGAQYLTQQAVARLAPMAGIDFPAGTPFPEQLIEVQRLMAEGDERAGKNGENESRHRREPRLGDADVFHPRRDLARRIIIGTVGWIQSPSPCACRLCGTRTSPNATGIIQKVSSPGAPYTKDPPMNQTAGIGVAV